MHLCGLICEWYCVELVLGGIELVLGRIEFGVGVGADGVGAGSGSWHLLSFFFCFPKNPLVPVVIIY
jgi:hypothetical protein